METIKTTISQQFDRMRQHEEICLRAMERLAQATASRLVLT
jgi:hypothetical protein